MSGMRDGEGCLAEQDRCHQDREDVLLSGLRERNGMHVPDDELFQAHEQTNGEEDVARQRLP